MVVRIKRPPVWGVTNLAAPARVVDTWRWQTTFKVPSEALSDKSDARATYIEEEWELGIGRGYAKNPKSVTFPPVTYNAPISRDIGVGLDWSNGWKNCRRESFYPFTSTKLEAIYLHMRLCNEKGKGPDVWTYCSFLPPANPTVAALVQNASTGNVSTTIKANRDPKGVKESYDTRYRLTVLDTRTSPKAKVVQDRTSTANTISISYDVADRQQLTYDQYVRITLEAWNRGFRGDSGHVSRSITVAYPAKATVKGVDVPTTAATGKVTVRIATNRSANHPVTGCKLQKLVGVSYKKASEIPASASWDDTSSVDNGTCTALSIGVADVKPDAGLTSWVRVKTWNDVEGMFYRYSEPVRLTKLETPLPSAQDDDIKLLSLTTGDDGESAIALMGWNADGTDDADGTVLTWSDDPNAWSSTDEPNQFIFDWSDGALTWTDPDTQQTTSFRGSATVHIRGLDENTLYFARARRYKETDLGTTYSAYSDTLSVLPTTAPGSVTLMAPAFIERGRSLQLSWTYSSDSPQTAWEVVSGDTVVASGQDPIGSCVIAADRLSSLVSGDTVTLYVRMSTGGEFVASDPQVVRIADAPTLELTVPATVTAQGPSIGLASNAGCFVACVITADGMQSDYPDGVRTQTSGDTVWSGVINPEWTEGADGYSATFPLPTGLALWDGASYTVTAAATDPEPGLVSEQVQEGFSVAWAHQAPEPSDAIVLTPSDVTDEDGVRTLSVAIQLAAPADALETDVYDIYRVTPDGASLIAVDAGQTDLVTDPYAPYGGEGMAYRIACRTQDGDISWLDYQYELDGQDLRIDFGGRCVELPYNLVLSDSYTKDFESRGHLGSRSPQGYWNENVARTSSLSTDVFKVREQAKQAALRELATFPAPCFVRLPNGCAFQANVDVKSLDWGHSTGFAPVALDATEVGLTAEYMAVVPIPEEEVEP